MFLFVTVLGFWCSHSSSSSLGFYCIRVWIQRCYFMIFGTLKSFKVLTHHGRRLNNNSKTLTLDNFFLTLYKCFNKSYHALIFLTNNNKLLLYIFCIVVWLSRNIPYTFFIFVNKTYQLNTLKGQMYLDNSYEPYKYVLIIRYVHFILHKWLRQDNHILNQNLCKYYIFIRIVTQSIWVTEKFVLCFF